MLDSPNQSESATKRNIIRRTFTSAVSGTATLIKSSGKKAVQKSLDALVNDPDIPPGMLAKVLEQLPLISASRGYATARKQYFEAVTANDTEKIRDAQVKCLIAFQDAGLDVGLFFAMRMARTGRLALKAAGWVTTLKLVGPLSAAKTAVTTAVASQLLKSNKLESAVIKLLCLIEPRVVA